MKLKVITNTTRLPRDSISIRALLRDIDKKEYDQLSHDEETKLGVALSNGDKEATEQLIKHNMRFVIGIAKEFYNPTMAIEFTDIVSAGLAGLTEAASERDYTKGFKFITYAARHITGEMIDEIKLFQDVVHIPKEKRAKLHKYINRVANQEGENINAYIDALVDSNSWKESTKKDIMYALEAYNSSYDQEWHLPVYGGNGQKIENKKLNHGSKDINLLADETSTNVFNNISRQEDLLMDIQSLLNTRLTTQTREIVCHYYGILGYSKLTRDELAEKFYYSTTSISDKRDEFIKILKEERYKNIFKAYLD